MTATKMWLLVMAGTLALILVGANIVVHFYPSRDPPNYNLVEKGLYMGGREPAPPPGTRAVLNLCEVKDEYEVDVQRWSAIKDAPPAPGIDWLREQVDFIDQQRQAGRPTYVHCHAGVSRAALVITAYEMRRHGWTRDQALEFVRSKRSVINPNPAFRELLLEWEEFIKHRP